MVRLSPGSLGRRGEVASVGTEFRFDAEVHRYYDDRGRRVPSITQMMQDEGLVDAAFYTPEGRDRGHAVHDLTRDWDLGVLETLPDDSPYGGYISAYQAMTAILQPRWDYVEVALFHPKLRFGGRPDRVGWAIIDKPVEGRSILEIKSGAPHKSTGIQLALQAILLEPVTKLPPHLCQRIAVHLQATGRYKVSTYPALWEIEKAYRIIRTHCR